MLAVDAVAVEVDARLDAAALPPPPVLAVDAVAVEVDAPRRGGRGRRLAQLAPSSHAQGTQQTVNGCPSVNVDGAQIPDL